MEITSVTNAGSNNEIQPTVAAVFSWTTSVTQAFYQFKYREVGSSVWVDTGRVASSSTSFTIAANTLSTDRYYEWSVRAWDGSQNVSSWHGMTVLVCEYTIYKIIHVAPSTKLKAVDTGKSVVNANVKIEIPNNGMKEMDVVEKNDYAASNVRIAIIGGDVKAFAKKLEAYTPTYSDHTDTGYIAYSNFSNTGYSEYNDHVDTSYTVSTYSQSGYSAYKDHTDTGSGDYTVYTQDGYSAYSNFTNSGYSAYSNFNNYYS